MSLIDHGLILPLALFNCISATTKPKRRSCYAATVLAYFGYMIWLLHIRSVTGSFVYPFMNVMGIQNLLTVFFPCLFIIGCCFVELSLIINSLSQSSRVKSD